MVQIAFRSTKYSASSSSLIGDPFSKESISQFTWTTFGTFLKLLICRSFLLSARCCASTTMRKSVTRLQIISLRRSHLLLEQLFDSVDFAETLHHVLVQGMHCASEIYRRITECGTRGFDWQRAKMQLLNVLEYCVFANAFFDPARVDNKSFELIGLAPVSPNIGIVTIFK